MSIPRRGRPLRGGPVELEWGALDGRLDALFPFLLVAERGPWRGRFKDGGPGNERRGLFGIADLSPSISAGTYAGLILPLSSCRDPAVRTALEDTVRLFEAQDGRKRAERRREAQTLLDAAGGGFTLLQDGDTAGFLGLARKPALFGTLHRCFDHVTRLRDDPAGRVEVLATEPFPWRSYGEALEWYHAPFDDRPFPWSHLSTTLVFARAAGIGPWLEEWGTRLSVTVPELRLADHFTLRPDLPDAELSVALRFSGYYTIWLDITANGRTVRIECTDSRPPFADVVAWAKRIDAGETQVALEIDEEGPIRRLELLGTDQPGKALFTITELYEETVHLQAVVDTDDLARRFKDALWTFLHDGFDPDQWANANRCEPDELPTAVLSDPWFDDRREAPDGGARRAATDTVPRREPPTEG
ncbi:hypothetical protein [Azospirillum doebereinerae]|uniref:Uncharacterized protein n=1 Tax=Azospirillum doebereinerae TaxID=92933 RepID=A0A3S0V8X1_9PROT|nr:hypothetical protein [Azospirillum doebereinerae]RUQ75760.1 hypothetical protein EJ913_01200 [Azospirillum doebereinerae]